LSLTPAFSATTPRTSPSMVAERLFR
jgi:hypothetical protein